MWEAEYGPSVGSGGRPPPKNGERHVPRINFFLIGGHPPPQKNVPKKWGGRPPQKITQKFFGGPPKKCLFRLFFGGGLKLYDFGDLGARNLSQTSGFLKRSPELHSHRNPTNFDPFHKVLGLKLWVVSIEREPPMKQSPQFQT